MNIDERLERLAERHEALAQSVEILRATVHAQSGHIDKILLALEKDGENVRCLARIAEIHEHRISGLDDGGDAG